MGRRARPGRRRARSARRRRPRRHVRPREAARPPRRRLRAGSRAFARSPRARLRRAQTASRWNERVGCGPTPERPHENGGRMNLYDESRAPRSARKGGPVHAEDLVAAREQGRVMSEASHVIRAEEQIWEDSPQGRLKHIAHPKLSANVTDIEAYIPELPPDGRSGKHRHMAEEFIFVLEGTGYSLHWDVRA